MIEKREENSSPITAKGFHESLSTISLETIDLYLKQLEAQKLQVQTDISNSFKGLSSFLNAREKQLLRQVDAMHDHLILTLQSRKSFLPDKDACCGNELSEFDEADQEKSLGGDKRCSAKVSPGIEVSLDSKELESQIQLFGKVEMKGTSFVNLSEDNEAFAFPYSAQNYQETKEDHMLLYKPLESTELEVASDEALEKPSLDPIGDTSSCQDLDDHVKQTNPASYDFLSDKHHETMESKKDDGAEGNNTLSQTKINMSSLTKLSEKRSEDVQHWMREILNETNSEPTNCDPERFDLFTVLKCNLKKDDLKMERLSLRPSPQSIPESDLLLEEEVSPDGVGQDFNQMVPQECLSMGIMSNECDLVE